jgi:hypothetical protein
LTVSPNRTLTTEGVVARSSPWRPHSDGFAVQFLDLSVDDEDLVGDLIVRQLMRKRGVRCLVASRSAAERRFLTRRLTALGCVVTRAATPLELIAALDLSSARIDAVVIGEQVGGCPAQDVATFLARSFPNTRLIFAARGTGREPEHEETARLVDAVVGLPWAELEFGQALGIC